MTKKQPVTPQATANNMWGGHFEGGMDSVMEQINESISFDQRFYAQDIAGSIAHATMLGAQGILTQEESAIIIGGLKAVRAEIEAGSFTFSTALEDIHMNVESRLKELVGDVGGKLHTGRSRNDQVATDFKLWVRDHIDVISHSLRALNQAFIAQAEQHTQTIMPGFTHLQTAQPVSFAHHLMAYVEMFSRDLSRLSDCRARLNECPLGAAALAGTSFPIDREATALALGFDRPTRNSLDTVSDRDFALEYLFAISLTATHLSRLSEEIVIWMSSGFRFVSLSNAFTTGSSIMPQKRNPDAAELVRAKTGRLFGALQGLMVVMKGLPLAYSKDMQEDKEPVFMATDTILLCVHVMTGMVGDMQVHKDAMHAASQQGYSTATDIADWLVRVLDMPFRDAHHVTGQIVKMAEAKKCRLDELSLEEMQKADSRITQEMFEVLSVENSVASRTSFGGTSPQCVKQAIENARTTR